MEHIKIENLTFTYSGCEKAAIKGISLSVSDGEFVCLAGKSGSGKTTLLRCIKPIIAPIGEKSGRILYDGLDISELSERRAASEIGFVFQRPDLQTVTDRVWHEIAFGLENIGVNADEMRMRVAETAGYFGFSELMYRDTSTLSGGELQLLNLAAAVAMKPRLLLLDEPTSRLDPPSASEFIKVLKRINDELGTTVIMSEHRLDGVLSVCDRIAVVEDGEITNICPPAELANKLKNSEFLCALPVYSRLFSGEKESPVTVKQGREALKKRGITGKFEYTELKTGETAVELKNVSYRYSKNEKDILYKLCFTAYKGEICAVAGENASGKSTLAKIVCGIIKQYEGKVQIKGRTVLLPQEPSVIFSKGSILEDLSASASDESVSRVCKLFGLTETLLRRHPNDLSGGEITRAAMAKLLLSKPDIIVLDEPTQGIDAVFKKTLCELLRKLADSGITIIIITHDIEFAAECADRAAMLFDRSITSTGGVRQVFCNNLFYTTAAARVSRGLIENALTAEDIITICRNEKL